MATPQLPSELVCRIIGTARFLQRLDKLHGSGMWKTFRWYVGNRDVQQVPPSWASSWFLELIRALMDPSVRNIHLRSSMVGVLQGPLLKIQQLPFVLFMDIRFQPFCPVGPDTCLGLFTHFHPWRSRRNITSSKTITHGDVRYLPGYMHPDVIIDIDYDATNLWTHELHTGRQIIALMVQQLLVREYLQKRPAVPSWFSLKCDSCSRKSRSVSMCLEDSDFL
ncbi:hypothetical protein ABBQ38_011907 [Trebouxia sp. C0009 RCD-2024]